MHCELNLVVDGLLTDPDTGKIAPELVAIIEAMKNMKRANSGLTWIKQTHVRSFFEQLRGHGRVTHGLLDSLPPSRTRDYVRGLLVEHGALPRHDLYRDRFNEWTPGAIDRLDHPDDRDVITRFIRWHILRRMNEEGATSRGTFLRAKQTVTVAIDFLTWLRTRDVLLEHLSQGDLDAWQAGGLTTRGVASRFLGWAIKSKLIDPDLRLTPHRRGTSPKARRPGTDQGDRRPRPQHRPARATPVHRHSSPRVRSATRAIDHPELGRRHPHRHAGHHPARRNR
jgi:hypothetical protein